ncbi:MAG: hypothetical protein GOV00_03465 [Candidatus Altiarchaeota archaeon]|nr:hypothetical protein [Candidatus Altiarchaeota archaeon]
MRQFVLPLVFGVAFTLMSSNLLAVDFSGELTVLFDNETLFETNGSSKVRSSVTLELPVLPGEHILTVNNQSTIYHLFEVDCVGYGGVFCEVNSSTDLTLPVSILCGDTFLRTTIFAPQNITTTISLEGICTSAIVEMGDWTSTLNVTPVFKNQVLNAGPGSVGVYRDGELILNKTVNKHAVFPELAPGEYTIELSGSNTSGKLIIETVKFSSYEYLVTAFLVLLSMGLFFRG